MLPRFGEIDDGLFLCHQQVERQQRQEIPNESTESGPLGSESELRDAASNDPPGDTGPASRHADESARQSKLAAEFRRFAEVGSQNMSPFYSALAARISQDAELLAVASECRPGQPPVNMLFGAVRCLLDKGAAPELLALYPHTAGVGSGGSDACPAFKQFVLENREAIVAILRTRSVQTNVVRRAAVLLQGLLRVAEKTGGRPIAHVEVGSSFGMTLLWQQFSYDYGNGLRYGPPDSPVRINSRMDGKSAAGGAAPMPPVVSNVGIEVEPVGPDDADGIAWLGALIWPEHNDNRDLWRAALPLALETPPRIVEGDVLEALPEVVGAQPAELPVTVYHSHTLNQFSREAKDRFEELLLGLSGRRQLFRISFEGAGKQSELRLFEYAGGRRVSDEHLADCEAHGRWIRSVAG